MLRESGPARDYIQHLYAKCRLGEVVAVVSFGMLGIKEAGAEIERPFDTGPNALPLERICATIARDATAACATREEPQAV